jgi:hypothetical protein
MQRDTAGRAQALGGNVTARGAFEELRRDKCPLLGRGYGNFQAGLI